MQDIIIIIIISFVAATRMPKSQSATKKTSSSTSLKECVVVPQLVVPIHIDAWSGKAIMDTGASYIHPSESHEAAYLAIHGPVVLFTWWMEKQTLGCMNSTMHLHNQVFTLPAAILPSHALAYAVVLGLDFIFFCGLQLNVIDQKYFLSLILQKSTLFNQEIQVCRSEVHKKKERRQLKKKTQQNFPCWLLFHLHHLHCIFNNLTI